MWYLVTTQFVIVRFHFLHIKICLCLVLFNTISLHHKLLSAYCVMLLNQASVSRRPARAWFFKIDPVEIVCMCVYVCVCVCVCVCPRGY